MDRVIPPNPVENRGTKASSSVGKAPGHERYQWGATGGDVPRAQSNRSTRVGLSALARGCASVGSLLLPGVHAIRAPFVEVLRAHGSFDPPEPHSLSHLIAHARE